MAFGISGKVSNRLPTFYDLDESRSHFNANKNDVHGSKTSLSSNDDKVLNDNRKLIISPMDSSGSMVCPGFSGVVAPCPAATKYFRHKAKNKSFVNVESISKISHSKVLSRASTVGSDSTIVANGSSRKYGKKTNFAKKKSSSFDISSENYHLKRRGIINKISTSHQCEESSFDSENEPDICLKKDLFALKTLAGPDTRKDGVRDCFITQKELPKESCGDVSWPYQGSSEQLTISFDNCRVKSFQRKHKLRRVSDLNYANNKKFNQENFNQDLFKKDDIGLCGLYKDYYAGLKENAHDGDDDTYKKLPNFGETIHSQTFKMRPKVKSDYGSFKFFQQCTQSSRNMEQMDLDRESEILSISEIPKRPTVLYGLDGDSLNQKRETNNQEDAARAQIFAQFDNGEKFSKKSGFSEFDDEDEWVEYEDFPGEADEVEDENNRTISSGDEETDSDSSYNESICVINEKANEEKRIMQENIDKEDDNDVDDDDDVDDDIKSSQAHPRCKRCYKKIISKRNGKEDFVKIDHSRSRDDMAIETLRSKGCKNNPGFYSARDQITSREEDGRNYDKNGNYLNNHTSWWNYETDKYSVETNNSKRNIKVQGNNGLHDEMVNENHSDEYTGFDVATLSMSNHNNSRCFQKVFPCENASGQPEEGLPAPRCHQLMQQTGASMDQANLYGFNKPFHFNYCAGQFSNQAAIDHFPPILSSVSGNVIHQCCLDQAKHPQQVSFLEQYPSACNGGNWIPGNTNQLESDQMQKCQPPQDQSFQTNESHHCQQFLFNHQQQQHHHFQLNNLQMKANNFVSPMMQIMDCSEKDHLFSQYCQQQQQQNEEVEDTIRHYSPPPPPPPSHQPQQNGNQWTQQEQQVLQRESRMTGTPCRHHHHYIHTNLYPNHATHLLHQLQDRLKRQKLMEDLKLDKTNCDKDNTNVDTENSSTKSNQRDQMSIRADSKESCNSAERVELESLGGESSSRKKEAVSIPDSQSISIFDSSLCHELSATDNNKTLEDCDKSADFGDCKLSNDQSREGHSSEGETLKKSKKECEKTPSRDTSIRTDSAQSETMQSLSKSNSFDKLYLDLIQNQLSSLKDSVQALTDAFYGKQEKKTDPELSAHGEVTNSLMKNFSLLLKENQSLSKRFDHLEQALSKTLKYEKENCELARETPHANPASKTFENVEEQKLPQRVPSKRVHLQVDKCPTNGNSEVSDAVEIQNANVLEGNSSRFSELPNTRLQQYFDDPSTQHLNNKTEESHDSQFLISDAMMGKWNGSCFLFNQSEEAAKGHSESQEGKVEANHTAEKNAPMTPFLEEKVPSEKSPKLIFNNSDHRPMLSDENNKKKQALDEGYTFTTSNMEKNDEKLNSRSEKHHIFTIGHPVMCKVDEMIADCNKFITPTYNSTDCQPSGEVKELRNNTMDSIPAIYRSFMNNSTNRFSMGCNNISTQSEVSGKDVASFRHRFFTEERDKKRFSPCERFSTNWKSDNKASGSTKDKKSDNRQQTMFPYLSDSSKSYAPCNPDTCDSVIMDLKGNGENHWRMNNIVGITENVGSFNEHRSPSGRPLNETEAKCYDFMPNTLRGSSHKSKLSNLAQTCAELWDSNSKNKDSNLPKSLKNHFLSGNGCQLSIDPCSSFHVDSKEQQSSTKLKKLNNANLNFDHNSSLPLDIFQDKLATANIHRSTEYGPIAGSSNFKMINVDLDKKCKQIEGTSPSSRFRICQSDLIDAYQYNATEALLDPCISGLETNKAINGGCKTKHSFPQKFSVSWNPQQSLVGVEGNSLSNERKFLERMKISNASLKLGDNNPTDYQTRKNLKNCPERREFPFTTIGKDFQTSNPICVDECSTATLQGNMESDNNKNMQDMSSVAKQNTVNIVFNDGVRPEQAGHLTPEEVPNKVRPQVAEANSLGQRTMKNCLNVKKTNNINVNFSNNCSECNCGADEGTINSPNEPQKIDEKYSISSNHYISLKEAKEYESGDHASLVSCNDEHYDLTQFSSGPTSNYIKPGAETGDALGYASRAEWGLPNNTFRSGDHMTAGIEIKITNSLERVYKEVSSFISANESRTKYLTELFTNLKKLDSEELRLKAVSALNTIVAEQLSGHGLESAVHHEENNNHRAFIDDETERDNHSFIEIENWDILSQYNSDAEVLKSYNTNGGYRESQQIIKSKSQPAAGLRFKSMSDCKLQIGDNDSEDYESSEYDERGIDNVSQECNDSAEHSNSISGKPDEKAKSLELSPRESPDNIGKSKEVNALIEAGEVKELSEKTEKVVKNKSKEYVQSVFDIISKSHISSDSMNLSSFDKFIEKIRNPAKSQNILSGDDDNEDNDENDDEDDDDDDDDDDEDNDDAGVSDKEDNTDEDNGVDDKEGDDDEDEDEDEDDDDKEDDDVADDDNDYDDEDNDDESSIKKEHSKSLVPKESSIASDVTKSTAKSSSSSASNSSVQASDDDDDDDDGDDNDENAENDGDDDDDDDDDDGDNDVDNDDDEEDEEDEDITDGEEEKKDEEDKEDDDDDDDDDDDGESHLIHKDEGKGDGASVTIEEKLEKISNPSKTFDRKEHPSNQNAGSYDVDDDDDETGSSQNHNNDCKNFEDAEEDLIKGIGNESYYEEDDDFKDTCSNNHVDGRFIIPSHYKDEDCYGEDQGDRDVASNSKQPCSKMEVEMQIFKDDHVKNDPIPNTRNENNAVRDSSTCFLNNNNKDGDIKAESVDLLEHDEMSPEQLEEYLLSKETMENNEKLPFERKENLIASRKLDGTKADIYRRCFSLTEHDSDCPLAFDFSSDPEFKHQNDSKMSRSSFQYPENGHLKETLTEGETNNKISSAEESVKDKIVNDGDCEIKEINQDVKYNNHTKFADHNGNPENHNHKSDNVDDEVDQFSDDDIYWGKGNISSTSHEKYSSLNKFGKGGVSQALDEGQPPLMPFNKLVGKSPNLNINSFNLSKEVIDRWERHRKYAKTQDIYEGAKRMFGIKSGKTSQSPYTYSARHSEHIVLSKAKKIFKPSNILGLKEPKNLYVDPLKMIKVKRHKREPSFHRKYKKKERQIQVDNIFTGRRKSSLSLSKSSPRSSSKCDYVYRRDERDDYDDDSYSLISEEIDSEHDRVWKSSDEDKSLLASSYMHRRSRLP